jgi:glycosyltransferase involved in cell wall biosynthesis
MRIMMVIDTLANIKNILFFEIYLQEYIIMKYLSISVCIPCVESHIIYLPDCLNSISNQTHKPNEVIICISNISSSLEEVKRKIELLCSQYIDLNIKVDFTAESRYAGENRNKAVEISTGEIITFIDADDLMRCDRLYVIHKIFSLNPDAIGIIHKFYENKFPLENQKEVNFDKIFIKKYMFSDDLHFGHSSFRREIFNEYKYSDKPRGQDIEFVHNILDKYINKLFIYNQPLTYYISDRSTFYK